MSKPTISATKRPMKILSATEKLSAIKRVYIGNETKASVARSLGVPESTLRGWCKNQSKIYALAEEPNEEQVHQSQEEEDYPPTKRMRSECYPIDFKKRSPSPESVPRSGQGHCFISVKPLSALCESEKQSKARELERLEDRRRLVQLGAELGVNSNPVLFAALLKPMLQYPAMAERINVPQSQVQVQRELISDTINENIRPNDNNKHDVNENEHFVNNNNMKQDERQSSAVNIKDALAHGHEFLNWLQMCSHPSVTAFQVKTVEKLLIGLESPI